MLEVQLGLCQMLELRTTVRLSIAMQVVRLQAVVKVQQEGLG